jgi:ABC-type antimicrobial peptide transport system permease subunit
MGMDVVRGNKTPLVLAGRLPLSKDEVALGRVSARRADVAVGDNVTLTGTAGSHDYTVVGIAVLTGLGSNDGIGEGALTTLDGLREISDDLVTSASIDFTQAASDSVRAYAERFGLEVDEEPFVPAAITSLRRVRSVPYVLAGLLGVLVVLTITQTLLSSLRARRRDLAIMRALGGPPRLLRRSVHWQATVVTLVPALVGIPLGVVAGRLVFRALADEIGALNSAVFPIAAVIAVTVGIIVLANLVAVWPARLARRLSAAVALRTE